MEAVLTKAIEAVQKSQIAFTKFITANDTGSTGAHQSGFHIHKNSWPLIFSKPGVRGENRDKIVTIKWQDDFETTSRFIYYGVGTRNEYRLTRFGKGFPFLSEDNEGDLLVLCKMSKDYYTGFVLQVDEDIDEFFAAFNISSNDTNGIVPMQFEYTAENKLLKCFTGFLKSLKVDFPPTVNLALNARNCYNGAHGITNDMIAVNPDNGILSWLDAEFQLFKVIENDRYNSRIKKPFATVEELVNTANTILNRRKSRAGKSLEHHLAEIFKISDLKFSTQVTTEDKRKPDFIFPTIEQYKNKNYSDKKLVMLASKTTCKDRWRQILNEADRIKTKHLFTLQQAISMNQLKEMYKYDVCLVVPQPYLKTFPEPFRDRILTLDKFVKHVRNTQA